MGSGDALHLDRTARSGRRFRVRSLPPGDYYAVAVDNMEPGRWIDPDFLDSVIHAATGLSLDAGETKSIDLKLAEPYGSGRREVPLCRYSEALPLRLQCRGPVARRLRMWTGSFSAVWRHASGP